MGVIENIFYLSIVYIVFNIIWVLIVQLPKMIFKGASNNSTFDHVIKAIRYLLLSTLTYSTCYEYITDKSPNYQSIILIYLTGGIILSLYLAGKLNKKQSLFKMAATVTSNLKFGRKKSFQKQLNYEGHIVGVSIVIYAACVGIPIFGDFMIENPLNIWFLKTIDGLYNAPILKWIIGFAGTIFMFSMFQRGITTIQQLIGKIKGENPNDKNDNPLNKIMDEFEKMNPNSANSFEKEQKKVDIEDDLYVDFEEMEDDEKEEK